MTFFLKNRILLNLIIVIIAGISVNTFIFISNIIAIKIDFEIYTEYGNIITRSTGIVAWMFILIIAWKTVYDDKSYNVIIKRFNINFFMTFFVAGIVIKINNIFTNMLIKYKFGIDENIIHYDYMNDHATTYYVFFGGYLCFKLANARGFRNSRDSADSIT